MIKIIFISLLIIFSANGFYAQELKVPAEKKQYLYLLRLDKSMLDSNAWTPGKSKIVGEHFANLQKMLSDGILILAGRTQVADDKTFGIVIYEAGSFEEAKFIAENDPAVKAGIMSVEVFPYEVALIREKEKK